MSLDVRIADIPQSVLDRVGNEFQNFLVPVLALSKQSAEIAEPSLKPVASGTLVEIDGRHCILTAAHVWDATKQADKIHLALTAGPSAFTIPREFISGRMLWNHNCPEWGPDLALLEISQPYVSTIAARKSFLNLSLQKATLSDYPLKTEKGFWVFMGIVKEFSDIDVRRESKTITADVQGRVFFSRIRETHDRQGYDYLDVSANLELPDVPSSFGGVSGGSLWQIDLSMSKSGIISWDGKRHFRGVAFWESPVSDGRRVVRCHGPRSIFETAWTAWGLPKGA